MPDAIDWKVTTFAGNRLRRHQEFHALSFREKVAWVEQNGAVVAYFASRRGGAAATPGPGKRGSDSARRGTRHGE